MRGPELDTNAAESPSSLSLSINIITPKDKNPSPTNGKGFHHRIRHPTN